MKILLLAMTILSLTFHEARGKQKTQTQDPGGFTKGQMNKLLEAEFAYYRDDLERAVKNYMEVAEETRDLGVVKQALNYAIELNELEEIIEAYQLVLEIDPSDIETRKKLVPFLVMDENTDEAVRNLKLIAETMSDSITESEPVDQTPLFHSVGPVSKFDFALDILSPLGRWFKEEFIREELVNVMEQFIGEYGKENTEAQVTLAKLYVQVGSFDEALSIVSALNSDSEEMIIFQSWIFHKKGDNRRALHVLSDFLGENPDASLVRMDYAVFLTKLGYLDGAIGEFEELIRRNPENEGARHYLGGIFMKKGDLDEAAKYFEQLIDSQSTKIASLSSLSLGNIQGSRGQLKRAIDSYKRVPDTPETRPYWWTAQMRIVVLLEKTEGLEPARKHLRGLTRENDAEMEDVYAVEARMLSNAGRFEEAITLYEQGLSRVPWGLKLIYGYMNLSMGLGKKELDVSLVEPGLMMRISREPDNPEPHNLLGYILTEYTDRYDEAYKLISHALFLSEEAHIMDSMGWVLHKMGENERALYYLNRAMFSKPSPEIAAHIGEVLWIMGRNEEARQVWMHGFELEASKGDHEYLQRTINRLEGVHGNLQETVNRLKGV